MKIFFSIFFIVTFVFITSKIKLNLKNFEHENFNYRFELNLEMHILNFIKIFSVKITEKGIKILFVFIPFYNINIKKIDKKTLIYFELLKKTYIASFNLQIQIGLENIIAMTYIISFLSGLISSFELANNKKINHKNFNYNIIPKYDTFCLKSKLNANITIPTISIVYFLIFNK